MPDRPEQLSTTCVHAGEHTGGDTSGSPHTPVYTTTTFGFDSTAAMEAVVSGEASGNLYTRYGHNPTVLALEEKLARIEDAPAALAFASGMAALSATFLALGRDGIVCLGEAYGGTMELLAEQLPALGIPTTFLLGSDGPTALSAALEAGAGMVFFETPSNPTMELVDIAAVATVAQRHGAITVVDNTFASPVNQRPLEHGADLVVHSATKYLGGHSDLTAGAVMGSEDLVRTVWNWRKNLGQAPAPETAALLARSLRTLPLRVQRQNDTAHQLAERLQSRPGVLAVRYPGLPSHPQHDLAVRQMRGFGGMLSIELDTDRAGCAAVADALDLITLAPSLGSVESLAVQPVACTHYWIPAAERERRGLGDALLRLSVGLEDIEDLWVDLDRALNALDGADSRQTPSRAAS